MPTIRLLIAISIAVLAQSPALAIRQSGSIAGVAVDRLTGRPISNVQVELKVRQADVASLGPELPRIFQSTGTAADGAFRFESVPAGNYQLVFRHDQYLKTVFIRQMIPSLKGEPFVSTEIQLSPGQTIAAGLIARLTPGGTIRGNVSGRDGSPLVARVTAFSPTTSIYGGEGIQGQALLEARASVVSNDRGEYRMTGLAPGPYFLRATAELPGGKSIEAGMTPNRLGADGSLQGPVSQTVRARSCDTPGSDIVPQYYPATASPENAEVLDLPPGGMRDGVNFTLAASPARTVSGVVLQTGADSQASPVIVELVSRSRFPESETAACRLPSMGAFSIRYVLPGEYFLKVSTLSATRTESVKVDADDLNLRIALDGSTASATFLGRILGDEGMQTLVRHPGVRLYPFPLGPANRHSPVGSSLTFSSISDEGLFAGFVPPGTYAFDLLTRPAMCCAPERLGYAETIRLDDIDASNGLLRFAAETPARLEIRMASPVGFSGRLVDPQGVPLQNRIVALVPNPPLRNRFDLYRNALTDAGGSFTMLVPRGEFKVFVREGVDARGWENPSILRAYEHLGRGVRIGDAGVVDFEVVAGP